MELRNIAVAFIMILCGLCLFYGVSTFCTFRKEIDEIRKEVDVCVQKEKENTEYIERTARQYEQLFWAYTKGVQEW